MSHRLCGTQGRLYTGAMTAATEFDPRALAVEAFARRQGELSGSTPIVQLERLQDLLVIASRDPQAMVAWSATGELRSPRGGSHEVWLHLAARGLLRMQCQRCLQGVEVELDVARSFLFVHGEALAAERDAYTEDDVLPLTRALDLVALVEDELLLALPIVPRHEPACPQPLTAAFDDPAPEPAENPFAVLAGFKRGGPLN